MAGDNFNPNMTSQEMEHIWAVNIVNSSPEGAKRITEELEETKAERNKRLKDKWILD